MLIYRLVFIICLLTACHDDSVSSRPLILEDASTTGVDGTWSNPDTQPSDQAILSDALSNPDQTLTPTPSYDFESQSPWYTCPDPEFGSEVIEITAFDRADHYFNPENLRNILTEIEFPEGNWSQIGMWIDLECPESQRCDHWDRSASIQLQTSTSEPQSLSDQIELTRYITPYRKAMCQFIDVTELSAHLTGPQILTSWIDTWVGPGHEQGEGWRITVKFFFFPGNAPAPEVLNVWGRRSITVGQVEPELSVTAQTEPVNFMLPDSFSRVIAHLITTGHSFGNTDNCAEFCEMRQDLIINDTVYSTNPWRPDCDQNPVTAQLGTWTYPRNGWCPGAVAVGDRIDITRDVSPGINRLDFDILLASGTVYVNTNPVDLLPHEWVSLKLYIYP